MPAGTLVLVLFGGWWAGNHLRKVDPLRAAQHRRLSFQSADDAVPAGLSLDEARRANDVLDRLRAVRAGVRQILYLGNSQALAIMDRHPGDLTSPQWLQVLLGRGRATADVRLGALPNMTTEEALVSVVAAVEDRPARADAVVAGVVLEEFRGVGSRAEVKELARHARTRGAIRALLEANPDLPSAASALSWTATVPGAQTSHGTWTSAVDDAVLAVLSRIPLVAGRDRVRAYLVVKFLAIRNRLLRISTASARPVPDATFRTSVEMLELLLRYCRGRGVPVLLYLAPIRPLEPNPNLPRDVARFRRDVPALCARYQVTCLDYVHLIPGNLWSDYDDEEGTATAGQRDFAHFTGAAHRLLAESLIEHVDALLAEERP